MANFNHVIKDQVVSEHTYQSRQLHIIFLSLSSIYFLLLYTSFLKCWFKKWYINKCVTSLRDGLYRDCSRLKKDFNKPTLFCIYSYNNLKNTRVGEATPYWDFTRSIRVIINLFCIQSYGHALQKNVCLYKLCFRFLSPFLPYRPEDP